MAGGKPAQRGPVAHGGVKLPVLQRPTTCDKAFATMLRTLKELREARRELWWGMRQAVGLEEEYLQEKKEMVRVADDNMMMGARLLQAYVKAFNVPEEMLRRVWTSKEAESINDDSEAELVRQDYHVTEGKIDAQTGECTEKTAHFKDVVETRENALKLREMANTKWAQLEAENMGLQDMERSFIMLCCALGRGSA